MFVITSYPDSGGTYIPLRLALYGKEHEVFSCKPFTSETILVSENGCELQFDFGKQDEIIKKLDKDHYLWLELDMDAAELYQDFTIKSVVLAISDKEQFDSLPAKN